MRQGSSTNVGGASGSFFFFTEDNKYIIKTITAEELSIFKDLTSDFEKHCSEQK